FLNDDIYRSLGHGDVAFNPQSYAAMHIIGTLILENVIFPEAVRNSVKEMKRMDRSALREAFRQWWIENEAALRAEKYAEVTPFPAPSTKSSGKIGSAATPQTPPETHRTAPTVHTE